jgi:hypothetical protein
MVIKVVHHIHKHGFQKKPKEAIFIYNQNSSKFILNQIIVTKPCFSPNFYKKLLVISLLISWRNKPDTQKTKGTINPIQAKPN